jgi:hypothetical protein
MIKHRKKLIEEAGDPGGVLRSKAEHLQNIYDHLSGRLNSPVGVDERGDCVGEWNPRQDQRFF